MARMPGGRGASLTGGAGAARATRGGAGWGGGPGRGCPVRRRGGVFRRICQTRAGWRAAPWRGCREGGARPRPEGRVRRGRRAAGQVGAAAPGGGALSGGGAGSFGAHLPDAGGVEGGPMSRMPGGRGASLTGGAGAARVPRGGAARLSRSGRRPWRKPWGPGQAAGRGLSASICQTRDGVNGRAVSRMPSGQSASLTALASAARAPTVPASPQPFIPIWL